MCGPVSRKDISHLSYARWGFHSQESGLSAAFTSESVKPSPGLRMIEDSSLLFYEFDSTSLEKKDWIEGKEASIMTLFLHRNVG